MIPHDRPILYPRLANNSCLGERFSPDWSGYPANDDGDASRGWWWSHV
ncbi:hypothetical protein [uncultured Psychrobacter sp.]